MICPCSSSSLFFTCFVLRFMSLTITVLLCLKTLVISPILPLSQPAMTLTVSPALTCILCKTGRLFGLHSFLSHRLSWQGKTESEQLEPAPWESKGDSKNRSPKKKKILFERKMTLTLSPKFLNSMLLMRTHLSNESSFFFCGRPRHRWGKSVNIPIVAAVALGSSGQHSAYNQN